MLRVVFASALAACLAGCLPFQTCDANGNADCRSRCINAGYVKVWQVYDCYYGCETENGCEHSCLTGCLHDECSGSHSDSAWPSCAEGCMAKCD